MVPRFLAAAMTLVVMGMAEGNPFSNLPIVCPMLIQKPVVDINGVTIGCAWVTDEVRDIFTKGQAVGMRATSTCPQCIGDIYDAYPDWNNCEQFFYCYKGQVNVVKCSQTGSAMKYFNPISKSCDLHKQENNVCFNRNYVMPS